MYLGAQGFTVPKSLLNATEQTALKKALTFSPKNVYLGPVPKIFAWRENANKLYIPRFYGVAKYGARPFNCAEGAPINVEFKGGVRENQKPAIDAFMRAGSGLLELPCGFGKTVLGLRIISLLNLKTLIIVHKDFLVQQWSERIREFLPDATIGKIQGQTLDTDKDIVIGMVQTIAMKKEYDYKLFSTFGLTIIDETHHMSAEVFSNALFKVVSRHMLGLSATMERADGLSNVFKLFLGDIVYSAPREKVLNVEVHKIAFESDDAEFLHTDLNFKGQANFSSLIKKLCSFHPRREFVLTVLAHLVQDPKCEQIMVLAQNKDLLHYLHDALEHRAVASVGYYVGGMKTEALKETETKKIILATYSMAKEALDIKTLTTLVMATPTKNVVQAVGRILRVKHARPLVVDIVDPHPTFKWQFKTRSAFYRASEYTLLESTSASYPFMRALTAKPKPAGAAAAGAAAGAGGHAGSTVPTVPTAPGPPI